MCVSVDQKMLSVARFPRARPQSQSSSMKPPGASPVLGSETPGSEGFTAYGAHKQGLAHSRQKVLSLGLLLSLLFLLRRGVLGTSSGEVVWGKKVTR